MPDAAIRPAGFGDLPALRDLRIALWPFLAAEPVAALDAEASAMLESPAFEVLLAIRDGAVVGFAEVSLRRDYVEGCESSPVGFLEGLYVEPGSRLKGVARALVASAQEWAAARGCREFASNALLDNRDSHAMHAALGFAETERVVYFRKTLG